MKPLIALLLSLTALNAADETVFSGPQVGEVTTPFKSLDIQGPTAGREVDVVRSNAGAPTALIFVHGIERSILPLMRAIDNYGAAHRDQLKTEFVFLVEDRVAGMERVGRALNSIKLKGRSTLSVDGLEGPGNYGLNKVCLLTILATKDNRVHANFALVQPGIADGGRVLASLAGLIGDSNPPGTEQLKEEFEKGYAMARKRKMSPPSADTAEKKSDPFPGAVPSDGHLTGLLRQFIRKTNDDKQINEILAQVRKHIAEDDALKKQAFDGWTRILHFGDRYGTDYARQQGRLLLKELRPTE
jgi:hypothetical protein